MDKETTKGKILVVDDNENNLKLLELMLTEKGYEVWPSDNSKEALKKINETLPDLILLDVMMPEVSGYELCQQLKAKAHTRDIPILFISARDDAQNKVQAFQVGGVDYITKPFQYKEVLARVETHLSLRAMQQQLEIQNVRLQNEIAERKRAEHALQIAHNELEKRIEERTQELAQTNIELQHEILAHQQTEEKLKDSEVKFRSISTAAQDAIVMIDEQSSVLFWNGAAERIFGYTQEEIIGKEFAQYLPLSSYAAEINQGELKAFSIVNQETVSGKTIELTGIGKNGIKIPVELSLSTVKIKDKWNTIGILRDITERKKTEEERNRLATAVEQAAEHIAITNVEGIIEYINPAFEQVTGYSYGEVIGKSASILKSGKHDEAFYKKMWETINQGEVWNGHVINRKKDGTLFEEEMTISPIRNEKGKIINFVAVKYDVTHEVQLEEQLRQSQKLEALGTLAAGIAHDFNNMLFAIKGYVSIVKNNLPHNTENYSDLCEIETAANRAADLVRQILTFSRQDDQKNKPVVIVPVIKEALKMMRATVPSTIEIRAQINENCGPIMGSLTQIHQVIINLCTNATHAMKKSGGILSVQLKQVTPSAQERFTYELKEGPYLMLVVEDTGVGIPPEIRDRIFDPFFTTKRVGEGTGMGLAVTHGIVKQHKGVVTVDSTVGKGTAFKIYFPVIDKQPYITERPSISSDITGNERILVVDDEVILAKLVRKMLEQQGYQVTAMMEPHKALKLFRSDPSKFDLIITDQTMPLMTGEQFAKEIISIRSDIPIVLITGLSDAKMKKNTRSPGVQRIMRKPLDADNLGVMIKELLHGGV
ncbi:response regulator [Deltaproteobacteria bacterium TL4]